MTVTVTFPDGSTTSYANASIALTASGGSTSPPTTPVYAYNVTSTGTLVQVSGPSAPLDTTYFSEADIVAACQAFNLNAIVTVNNNGNIHQAWPVVITQPGPTPTPPPSSGGSGGSGYTYTFPYPNQSRSQPSFSFTPAGEDTLYIGPIPTNTKIDLTKMGTVNFAEAPGGVVLGHDIQVDTGPGTPILYPFQNSWNSAPGFAYTVGNPNYKQLGAMFNVNPGDTMRILFKSQENQTTMANEMLCAILAANW